MATTTTTTNVQEKGTKLLVAKYEAYSYFDIPKEYEDYPLTCFGVLSDVMHIYSKDAPHKLLCTIEAKWLTAADRRRPDEINIENKDKYDFEDNCNCTACTEHADDPSKNKCCECECVLHDSVHIYVIANKDGDERVLCSACWQDTEDDYRADGYRPNDESDSEGSEDSEE